MASASSPRQAIPASLWSSAAASSPSFRLRSPSLNTLRLRRVFDMFDSDADGEISVDELASAMARIGLSADRADLAAAVALFVAPGTDALDFDAFAALHSALSTPSPSQAAADPIGNEEEEEEMREAFRVFDENGDGFISAKELQSVLQKLGLPEGGSMDRVQEMIGFVDRDHDGRVDFGEFKHMMSTVATEWP